VNLIRQKNQTWKRNAQEVARGAVQYARLRGVDIVFCGHIHMMHTYEKNNIKYFNTGSWVEKPSGYAVIINGEIRMEKVF